MEHQQHICGPNRPFFYLYTHSNVHFSISDSCVLLLPVIFPHSFALTYYLLLSFFPRVFPPSPLLTHFLTTPSSLPVVPLLRGAEDILAQTCQMFQLRPGLHRRKTDLESLENKFIQTAFCLNDRKREGKRKKRVMNGGRQIRDLYTLPQLGLCLK